MSALSSNRGQIQRPGSCMLSRDYNCDSTTIWLRYDDTTTHSTTTEVIEITIRLRYDYDVSTAPASIRREQKINVNFSS